MFNCSTMNLFLFCVKCMKVWRVLVLPEQEALVSIVLQVQLSNSIGQKKTNKVIRFLKISVVLSISRLISLRNLLDRIFIPLRNLGITS